MATIGKVTFENEGYFKWNIQNLREVWGQVWCFYSPYFTYASQKYYLAFQKGPKKDITLWLYSVHCVSPRLFLEFQLRAKNNIVSKIYDIILDKGINNCKVSVDFTDFFSKEYGKPLHNHLIILFLDRKVHGTGVLQYVFRSSLFVDEPKADELPEKKIDPEYESLKKLQKDLGQLLLNKEDSDVTLKVQGIEFPGHKIILRARSPVFNVMFKHGMKEADSGIVDIEDIDSKTFPDFLRYLYTGSIEHISLDNVYELYAVADKYEVLDLKVRCIEFMKCNMDVEAFCDFFLLAHLHTEEELINSGVDFFCEHVMDIVNSAKWKLLLQQNWVIGNQLFLEALSRGKDIP